MARTAPLPRKLIAGRLLTGSTDLADGLVAVEGNRIVYAGPEKDSPDNGRGELLRLPPSGGDARAHRYPLHGGYGADFPSADEPSVRNTIELLHRSGTTTLVASLVTASREDLLRGVSLFASLTDEAQTAGIHLEGPFLSPRPMRCPEPRLAQGPRSRTHRRTHHSSQRNP